MDNFVQPIITQCLSLDPSTLKHAENESFLHALANTTRDRKVIRDQIVAVLLAGRDTTAGTLSFLFHELSQHPEIVYKLRQEILRTVGSHRAPTYDDLKGMGYLQHCLSETLRMYPAVPFNVCILGISFSMISPPPPSPPLFFPPLPANLSSVPIIDTTSPYLTQQVRLALRDTTLPTGGGPNGDQPIGLLKDTPVGYSTLYMQRRAELYPPPSEKFPPHDVFSPERWEHWQPKSWNYIPFNGGPRICIGQQFALSEMGEF